MYDTLLGNLTGAPLLVLAVVGHFMGVAARKDSVQAAKYSAPLALAVFGLLLASGMSERGENLGDFLRIEALRLVMLGFALFGFASVAVRVGSPLFRTFVSEPKRKAEQAKAERARKTKADERAAFEKERQLERQRQYEAERPERERRERERLEQEKREQEAAANEADRREQARSKALLAYHRHAGEIADSFPWDRFREYTEKYMNDDLSAQKVEEHSNRLIEMIHSFFEAEKAPPKKMSRTEIHARFEKERAEVLALNYGKEATDSALAQIAAREKQALMEETL